MTTFLFALLIFAVLCIPGVFDTMMKVVIGISLTVIALIAIYVAYIGIGCYVYPVWSQCAP
jgi:hypothetical protein